jgi:hypothetical protein
MDITAIRVTFEYAIEGKMVSRSVEAKVLDSRNLNPATELELKNEIEALVSTLFESIKQYTATDNEKHCAWGTWMKWPTSRPDDNNGLYVVESKGRQDGHGNPLRIVTGWATHVTDASKNHFIDLSSDDVARWMQIERPS